MIWCTGNTPPIPWPSSFCTFVFGMDLVPMFSSDWETTAFPYALHQSILSFFIVFAGGWWFICSKKTCLSVGSIMPQNFQNSCMILDEDMLNILFNLRQKLWKFPLWSSWFTSRGDFPTSFKVQQTNRTPPLVISLLPWKMAHRNRWFSH